MVVAKITPGTAARTTWAPTWAHMSLHVYAGLNKVKELEFMEPRITSPRVPSKGHASSPGASPRLLSLKEAGIILGVSTATARRLVWQGRLPVVKLSRRILVDVQDVDKLIEASKERPGF